jgi:hypothetical protein
MMTHLPMNNLLLVNRSRSLRNSLYVRIGKIQLG